MHTKSYSFSIVRAKREKFIELMVTAVDTEEMISAYQAVHPTCISRESARISAYRLLRKKGVSDAIQRKRQERERMFQEAKTRIGK